MSGHDFGKDLKILRNKVGISSKVLSKKVDKAVTYVSQLERGLIKKPDFNTCIKILKELGLTTEDAEKRLNYFFIKSPEQEQTELDNSFLQAEKENMKHKSGYYGKKLEKVSTKTNQLISLIDTRVSSFARYDNSRADKVLDNLLKIFADEELVDFFFFTLFENDYTNLSNLERNKVLSLVNEFIAEKHNEIFFNLSHDMEDE